MCSFSNKAASYSMYASTAGPEEERDESKTIFSFPKIIIRLPETALRTEQRRSKNRAGRGLSKHRQRVWDMPGGGQALSLSHWDNCRDRSKAVSPLPSFRSSKPNWEMVTNDTHTHSGSACIVALAHHPEVDNRKARDNETWCPTELESKSISRECTIGEWEVSEGRGCVDDYRCSLGLIRLPVKVRVEYSKLGERVKDTCSKEAGHKW